MDAFTHIIRQFKKSAGFTLLELLITLTIIAILTGIGVPSFQSLYQLHETQAVTNRLINAIQFSRLHAISRGKSITLCPTIDAHACSKDWNQRLLVFVDNNLNGKRESNQEEILQIFDAVPENSTLIWRAFQNKNFIQFNYFGTTQQNGSLIYCPNNKDNQYARQLVINKGGRPRLTQDTNDNGIAEDTKGRDILC